MADWELSLAVSGESIIPYITSLVKNQNSKFEMQLLLNAYHFRTTEKSKIISYLIIILSVLLKLKVILIYCEIVYHIKK